MFVTQYCYATSNYKQTLHINVGSDLYKNVSMAIFGHYKMVSKAPERCFSALSDNRNCMLQKSVTNEQTDTPVVCIYHALRAWKNMSERVSGEI